MHIEVFAEILCPFTHVGLRRLIDARDARRAPSSVRVYAWPLEWVNGEPLDRDLVAHEIDALRASVAPDAFRGFHAGVWPQTSIPAFGLASSAYARDDATGEAVSLAIRDALFEQGLDVSDAAVLRRLGEPYGVLPLDEASAIAAVRSDFERGQSRAVRGSPHFFAGSYDWFCPSLEITKVDGEFEIAFSEDRLREFYAAAFAR